MKINPATLQRTVTCSHEIHLTQCEDCGKMVSKPMFDEGGDHAWCEDCGGNRFARFEAEYDSWMEELATNREN